ncbi:Mss4p nuclear export [Marasmius tenuissimus]|uniref:Protein BCP1 n=1 Tax=Marasmius tenuissimus TaxID=585030 RepID=A0ABR3A2Y0_9AGAR|nr:Mss4p nuclear export [Marasmius tenuissimus]
MSKRKQNSNDASDDESSDISMINVDFDFFDPDPEVDYQAIKRLLGQLFQRDADMFHLHELTELILDQPSVGTTIKTDGKESDPYALLTVVNMHVHKDHPSVKALGSYILEKSSPNTALHNYLQGLFSQTENHVGLVICERLINMPVETVPPMYRMLTEELKMVISQNAPFKFTDLIFISRTYHLTEEEESFLINNATAKSSTKKRSKKAQEPPEEERPADGLYDFHPEDIHIKALSSHFVDYKFTTAPTEPRDKESFGLDTRGRVMLVPSPRFEDLVNRISEAYAVG